MDWSVHAVHLVVQPARVAHNLGPVPDPPPQRGGGGGAVAARRVGSLLQAASLPRVCLDQRPVLSVHLVVEAARVAEVVAGVVPAPERRVRHPAVDALSAGVGGRGGRRGGGGGGGGGAGQALGGRAGGEVAAEAGGVAGVGAVVEGGVGGGGGQGVHTLRLEGRGCVVGVVVLLVHAGRAGGQRGV